MTVNEADKTGTAMNGGSPESSKDPVHQQYRYALDDLGSEPPAKAFAKALNVPYQPTSKPKTPSASQIQRSIEWDSERRYHNTLFDTESLKTNGSSVFQVSLLDTFFNVMMYSRVSYIPHPLSWLSRKFTRCCASR